MKEIHITEKEEGQSLHRVLCRILPEAGSGFLYKMLRKKNITLNDKKADGKEVLKNGDDIKIYFSDETVDKFSGSRNASERLKGASGNVDVVYEDSEVLILNKPCGMLSQKSVDSDISINEEMIQYLLNSGFLTEENLKIFRPSVCNRLDRNTSGLIICGKTIHGLQTWNQLLLSRGLHKYYHCMVYGTISKREQIHGYLKKDERTNKVTIFNMSTEGAQEIATEYTPIQCFELNLDNKRIPCTYLEVLLLTGRSHQIRAHLSSIGHPLLGDSKYGKREINQLVQKKFGVKAQLLHAYRLKCDMLPNDITAPLPQVFERILNKSI